MALYAYIYLFSVGTIFIIVVHLYNVFLFKKRNRDLLGKKFKQDSIEYERMSKLVSGQYMAVALGAILLAVLFSVLSGYKIFLMSDLEDALVALFAIPFAAFVTVVAIVCSLRVILGERR